MKHNSGMSVVELTVAAVLVGVVFLGISKLSVDFVKSKKTLEAKDDFNIIYSQLRRRIGSKKQCAKLFNSRTATYNNDGTVDASPAPSPGGGDAYFKFTGVTNNRLQDLSNVSYLLHF